ncbi:MAG: YIP1 family protein [Salinivirgaceae bacterium]|nr:YIP1 family protein [Salinivirgaceae bacterium]
MILKIKTEKIPKYWVFGIVLIYSLLMSEYLNTVSKAVSSINGGISNFTIFQYIATFNFFITILSAFVVWIISSFLFHIFSILLGGVAEFKDFIKYSGLIYILPAIGFAICLFLFESVEIPKNNIEIFFKSNSSLIAISWIINISSTLCFVLLIPIIKRLYNINWLKAIGAIAIPIGSIYLLGQFFANYVL